MGWGCVVLSAWCRLACAENAFAADGVQKRQRLEGAAGILTQSIIPGGSGGCLSMLVHQWGRMRFPLALCARECEEVGSTASAAAQGAQLLWLGASMS